MSQELQAAAERAPTSVERCRPRSTKASLLVVDDHEVSRQALVELLRRQGYEAFPCAGGAGALQMLQRGCYDLVLLDVVMQDMSGLEVLQAVRATYSAAQLPVIMVTGLDQSEDIVQALRLGASDYVVKPLDLPVLLARIQTQLSLKNVVEEVLRLERDLARRNAELEAANARMHADLEAAARVQAAFLPQEAPHVPGLGTAWVFRPCSQLAGDMLNVFAVDERSVGFYLLDVSGHGVAASLLAVTVSRFLQPIPGPTSLVVRREGAGYRLVPPAEVAARLNARFPWDAGAQQFFTILYGVLDVPARVCRFISAGHPGPIHIRAGRAAEINAPPGLPIGVTETVYAEHQLQLASGDRLVLYSDGAVDAVNADGAPFGKSRLCALLDQGRGTSLRESLEAAWADIDAWIGTMARDDVSLMALELTA